MGNGSHHSLQLKTILVYFFLEQASRTLNKSNENFVNTLPYNKISRRLRCVLWSAHRLFGAPLGGLARRYRQEIDLN